MSFEYGSQQVEIKNPFSFLGKLMLLSGILFLALGIILFLITTIRSSEIIAGAASSKSILIYHFIGAFILTSAGITMTIKGLFMVNKFYVGRGMPADLACEITKNRADYSRNPNSVSFTANQLHKSLINRMNPSFIEPSGLLQRLLHTYNPNLLYLPLPLRYITEAAFESAVYLLVVLIMFSLSILSGLIGVNEFISTPIWKYIGWMYVIMMAAICLSKIPKSKWKFINTGSNFNSITYFIAFSILIPVIAAFFNGAKDVAASPLPWLILFPLLAIGTFVYLYFLASRRIPKDHPKTEVSEFREQWEESINPQEIFRNVDMTLADYRYLEMSNRKYLDADTGLISHEKGEYSGSMIQETQPIPLQDINEESLHCPYKKICAYASIAMISLSGLWFFSMIAFTSINSTTASVILSEVIGMIMLYSFGMVLYKTAHTYFGEIQFKSHLIHFFADGTFNKSKISIGMSVYDSMRSENEVVQTSIRPWIVCSEIITTSFAVSGHYNLEQYRLILEMQKDDKWLDSIVSTLKTYMKTRKKLASTISAEDMQNTAQIAQINQIIKNGNTPQNDDTKSIDNKIAEVLSDDVKKNY